MKNEERRKKKEEETGEQQKTLTSSTPPKVRYELPERYFFSSSKIPGIVAVIIDAAPLPALLVPLPVPRLLDAAASSIREPLAAAEPELLVPLVTTSAEQLAA